MLNPIKIEGPNNNIPHGVSNSERVSKCFYRTI